MSSSQVKMFLLSSPLGLEKSLCYAVLPLAFDQLRSQEEKFIVVVILFGLEGIGLTCLQ